MKACFGRYEPAQVTLNIYDIQGRFIKTLVNESQSAGRNATQWYGTDNSGNQVAAGMYFARLQSGANNRTIKMVCLR
ncbi:T9SS type A sorting domain-containing protein [bacterium]|nr:T9SS type A sorting domain-containing protein [bacterium]